ncbi:YbhB/YbcL family Raf kinase inhibitor-like protein [Clostridia bacterium]|nr:YbhB/YbcL family Raf kinase inhibitor-like protein [Clostridia bacterium]
MEIKVDFDIIPDKFGKGASEEDTLCGNPVRSFPFRVENLPDGTKCIAFTLIDFDAVAVCGFPWIHWAAANVPLDGGGAEIAENFSRNKKSVQGKNSFASQFLQEDFTTIENLFVGPTPPDKDHRYTLRVYALSSLLELSEGFYLNELLSKMDGNILEEKQILLIGKY